MQKLSNDARRITQDIDFDFIQHSISDEGIEVFVNKINCIDGLMFSLKGNPQNLIKKVITVRELYWLLLINTIILSVLKLI